MTKEELKKRINEDFVILVAFGLMSSCDPNEFFRKLGITHLSDVNAQSQFIAFVVGILKQKKQVEEFALKNLEEQEKCCGNCDNFYFVCPDGWGQCEFSNCETMHVTAEADGWIVENDLLLHSTSLCLLVRNNHYCRLGWRERTV